MTIIVTKSVTECRAALERVSGPGVVIVNGVEPTWCTTAFRNLHLPDGWSILYLKDETSFENAVCAALQK